MLGHVGFMLGLYWVNWLYFGSYCSIHTGPRMIGASATVWYHLGLTNGHLHSSMHATMVEPKRNHKDVPRFAQTGTANQPMGNHPANVRMATCLQCSQLGPTDLRIIWYIMLQNWMHQSDSTAVPPPVTAETNDIDIVSITRHLPIQTLKSPPNKGMVPSRTQLSNRTFSNSYAPPTASLVFQAVGK